VKQVSGPQLAKAIEARGWILKRTKGSHHVYLKVGHRERIVIPIHGSRPLKTGLLRAQMKIAGLNEGDF
jgi:predicted RNA binding protein YcfA (HicA-like mRNA interferase family)